MAPKPFTLKKPVVLGLLAVLFYGQVGYYFAYRYAQYCWKEQVQQNLLTAARDDQFVAISLTANKDAIEWEEEGREFLLAGRMYDVVRKKCVKGETILYCLDDIREKQLVAHMNAVNPSRDQGGRGQGVPAFKPAFDPAIITVTDTCLLPPPGRPVFFTSASPLPEWTCTNVSPPPRV